jgi:hypothetical protein
MTTCITMASPRKYFLDQSLPRYEELKHSDHDDDDALPEVPPLTATPTEVSDFLFQLLVSTEALSSTEQARNVASRWELGTGEELRHYPATMYLEIFGTEEGWITYREVMLAIAKEETKGFWYSRWGFCKFSLRQTSRKIG